MKAYARLLATTFIAFGTASAAQAQDETWSICDIEPATYVADISESLVGNWSAANLEGLGIMSGGGITMPVPIPAEAPSSVDFILSGDDLQVTSWTDPEAPLLDVSVIPSSPIFAEVSTNVDAALSQEDISVVVGCDVTAYPVLGTSFTLSQDGATLNYQAVFRVLSESMITGAIYGVVIGEEGSIQVYRPVTMTR